MGLRVAETFVKVFGGATGSRMTRPEMNQTIGQSGVYELGFGKVPETPRGKVNVAELTTEFPALQFVLEQYVEDPMAEETHFLPNVEKVIALSPQAQPLFSFLAKARRLELVEGHKVDAEHFDGIIHGNGRKNILIVGNSGIKEDSVRERYIAAVNNVMNYTLSKERRVGNLPEEKVSLSCSLTNGVIEQITRELAYRYNAPIGVYGNDWFLSEQDFVDLYDKTMPPVLMTGADDYSKVSVANCDVFVSFGGGGFVLTSDLVEAIAQGKPAILHNFDFLPAYTKAQLETNPSGRQQFLANVVKALETEDWAYQQVLEKVQALSPDRKWTMDDIKGSLTITRTKEEFAEAYHTHTGNEGSLEGKFAAVYKKPILTVTSNELPEVEIEKIRRELFGGALFLLALTGRTQFDNREAGAREKRMIKSFIDRFVQVLRDVYGMSPYHLGILHGMSEKGSDGEFLKGFLAEGNRGYGVVKPEYFGSVTDLAMRLSSFVYTVDDYDPYSLAYVCLADALQVFEGNDGVLSHVNMAFSRNVPVILTDVTNNPIKSAFWDQEGGKWKYRGTNVTAQLREEYPDGKEGMAFNNSPELLAKFAYEVALARRKADSLEVR